MTPGLHDHASHDRWCRDGGRFGHANHLPGSAKSLTGHRARPYGMVGIVPILPKLGANRYPARGTPVLTRDVLRVCMGSVGDVHRAKWRK
jgi:hypothetical protein